MNTKWKRDRKNNVHVLSDENGDFIVKAESRTSWSLWRVPHGVTPTPTVMRHIAKKIPTKPWMDFQDDLMLFANNILVASIGKRRTDIEPYLYINVISKMRERNPA